MSRLFVFTIGSILYIVTQDFCLSHIHYGA